MSSDDVYPSFLTVFIDCVGIRQTFSESNIASVVKSLVLYIHSYVLLHRQNQICVICNSEDGHVIVFPAKEASGNFLPNTVNELLTTVNDGLMNELVAKKASTDVAHGPKEVSLTNPISRALCCELKAGACPLRSELF